MDSHHIEQHLNRIRNTFTLACIYTILNLGKDYSFFMISFKLEDL